MGGSRGGLEDLPVCQAPFTDWVSSDQSMRKSGQLSFNNHNDSGTTDKVLSTCWALCPLLSVLDDLRPLLSAF